jgi:hypothetical protein
MKSRINQTPEMRILNSELRESREFYDSFIQWLKSQRPPKIKIPHETFLGAVKSIPELRIEFQRRDESFYGSSPTYLVFLPKEKESSALWFQENQPVDINFFPWMRPDGMVFFLPKKGPISYLFTPWNTTDLKNVFYLRRVLKKIPDLNIPKPIKIPDRFLELFTITPIQCELYILCGENFGLHAQKQIKAADRSPQEMSMVFATQSKTDAEKWIKEQNSLFLYEFGWPADTAVIILKPGALVSKPLPQQKVNHKEEIDASEWFVHNGKVQEIVSGENFIQGF